MTNNDQENREHKTSAEPSANAGDAPDPAEKAKQPVHSQSSVTEPTQPPKKKPEKHKKTNHTKPDEKRSVPLVASMALLLAVAVAAGVYWQYQQSQVLSSSIEQLSSRQSAFDKQMDTLNDEISELGDQQQKLVQRAQQSEESRRSMLVSLDQLSSQLQQLTIAKGKQPLYWRVSEVEYLLTVANYRLTLERDVNTAKTALQDADNRLRSIGDPGLIPVREKISQELSRLNGVSLPDIPGLASQINSLISDVDQLPFVQKSMSVDSEPVAAGEREYSGFTRFVKTVWQDLVDGLFKVQRSDEPVEPLLPPREKQYLLHNLRLKLEQAHVALLQSDTSLFRTNLADIEQWVQRYFESGAPSVTNILQTVDTLKTTNLEPELPDISGSLRELRAWMVTQQNATQQSRISSPSTIANADSEVTGP